MWGTLFRMDDLTPRQTEVLSYIAQFIAMQGFAPTQNEIANNFGVDRKTAIEHLAALERKGRIRTSSEWRGISLLVDVDELGEETHRPGTSLQLPLIGNVAAGEPIVCDSHTQRLIAVDKHLFRPRPHFLLVVQGDSMVGAGIYDGDVIAVHRTKDASHGDIVVARLDGEITVKRFLKSGRTITLKPENARYKTREISDRTASDFAIEGRVVGVIRNL